MSSAQRKSSGGPVRAVFLCGFMGSGKSTVGQALAERLGWTMLDLDKDLETAAGKPIREIFNEEGETAFRRLETEHLSKVIHGIVDRPMVVALGGGAFIQEENRKLISAYGHLSVFLDAEVEELLYRCRQELGTRPLFQNENQFRQLYESRRSGYMKANLRVETSGRNIGEIVDEIISRLEILNDDSAQAPDAG